MATRKSKLLITALTVSLAVNIAIASFIGMQWYLHGGAPRGSAGLTFDRSAAFSVLDDQEKKLAGKIWRDHRSEMRSNIKEYRQAKKHLSSLLTSKELNKEAIEKAHKEMIEDRNKIEMVLNTTLLNTAEILPPKSREKFFKNGFQRWKSRHRRDKDHSFRHEKKERHENN